MRIAIRALIFALWLLPLASVAFCQAHYRQHEQALLNDPAFTPGATLPQDTKDVLCSPDFHTGDVRAVSEATKQQACRIYGVDEEQCTGQFYEIDHLISLELGGSNDIENLWPQPYAPKPGAREKDKVENWLHRRVCSGQITLAAAQDAIAQDWYAVYLEIPNAKKARKTSHAKPNGIPAGATGKCADGSYTFSQNHRGACSRHDGISEWF
jgi:hypothetical protein